MVADRLKDRLRYTVAAGTLILGVSAPMAAQTSSAASLEPLSLTAQDSAMAAVLRTVALQGLFDELDHFCIDLPGRDQRSDAVQSLIGNLPRPLYTRASCPSIQPGPTGGVVYVRKPPYVHVGVRGRLGQESADEVMINAWFARGMGGAGFRCRAHRYTDSWGAICTTLWTA